MIWVLILLLAAAAFGAAMLLSRPPRKHWEVLGAALFLGIAGYGLQGSPRLPGAPKAAPESISNKPSAQVEERKALADTAVPGSSWMTIADALTRRGRYADAATVLQGAVNHNPKDAEAWLAMANALVGHAEGALSPAALFAYQRAADAAPDHPGPPFFLGLALAQSGRFAEGRRLWADLLARSPKDAPWRADLEQRLARLDSLIAQQGGQMPPQ